MLALRFLTIPRTVLVLIGVLLAILPFVLDSRYWLILLTQVFIFSIFAMSYDILLGYTGIVSFGHAMFFGIGAYSVAIFMDRFGSSYGSLLLAIGTAILLTAVVSAIVGMLTLRLQSHFFAMLTLAVSGLFVVIAEKWRAVTHGTDGFTFSIPPFLRDRTVMYFICLLMMILALMLLSRFTHSPFGRVMLAIRENEKRTESLGYQTLYYKVIASVVAGVFAGFSGCLYALTLRFVNTTVLSVQYTLDVLLMTIIGGVGTLYGGILGAALIQLVHHYLTNLAKIHWIFERWLILFGIVYIVVVMVFPLGIIGSVRQWWAKRRFWKMREERTGLHG